LKIVIASSKNWFKEKCEIHDFGDLEIFWINGPEELSLDYLTQLNPSFIFFPHWNWKIDAEIFENFSCVGFHVAPLPYGRGGSPIQNLILEGFKQAPVNALIIGSEYDAGDILLSKGVSLEGTLSEIFDRISVIIKEFIVAITQGRFNKRKQLGTVKTYKRRLAQDNALPLNQIKLQKVYDFIRMLDSPEYPKAFIELENFRFELSSAKLNKDFIEAKVIIKKSL
jgi:methionyl-tRNA formyltransferase